MPSIPNEDRMQTPIDLLREQLTRHLARYGDADPHVAYLRWQIASLERQTRWREASAGMFGALGRTRAAARPRRAG
jgi:hypothetical protein